MLKNVIQHLKSQTVKLDEIVVVDNSSTDGTEEWLKSQQGLSVIRQENSGSSGGQYTGSKYAYEKGYDAIWLMDDDVVAHEKCLGVMLQQLDKYDIVAPLRHDEKGNAIGQDIVKLNLTNPFKSLWLYIVEYMDELPKLLPIDSVAFEGPIFKREVFEKIGFPDKDFFIFGDDTEFSIRAMNAGFTKVLASEARMDRLLELQDNIKEKFTWKHYYIIRNVFALDVLHGNFAVRTFRPIAYLFKWLWNAKSLGNVKTVLRAFRDGYFYKQGNVFD